MYGIDFGAKKAGTTVIAHKDVLQGGIAFHACAKGADADAFMLTFFSEREPASIYIDAPLSLPSVYALHQKPSTADYFYRSGDKVLGAMSPMFLGGLTARAMHIQSALSEMGHEVWETYPGALARMLKIDALGYKGGIANIPACLKYLEDTIGIPAVNAPQVRNWHHFDALLALCSAIRHHRQTALIYGLPDEGQIIV